MPDGAPSSPLPGEDDEVESARSVFRELDKAWRATRTYGLGNAVTRRFFEQLQAMMIGHLEEWPILAVLVERAELRLRGELVYGSDDSLVESLAFRLYADGVREVRFEAGVSPEDLLAFLEALWSQGDETSGEDDDVVTRLWSKELSTITFVTAEDILQAPASAELAPQEHGFFSSPPASFAGVVDRERRLAKLATTSAGAGPPGAGENLSRVGGGLLGFEITPAERSALDQALEAERSVDPSRTVLAMLRAILASEQSITVLGRALSVVPSIFDTLLSAGEWKTVGEVVEMLEATPAANAAFDGTLTLLVGRAVDCLNAPQRVALIERGLGTGIDGLAGLLARLAPSTVGPLCAVLSAAKAEPHRAVLRDALVELGLKNQGPILDGLADPRPQYVRDLIGILVAWKQPQAAETLSKLAQHPAPEVRAEAISGIARLRPSGDGALLLTFASDKDPEVRLHALRVLASGRYEAAFEQWKPHLIDGEAFALESRATKRLLFHALRVTARDGAVPLWEELMADRTWKHRQSKAETALLAVKELAALGTPRAREALERASATGSAAVRKACADALAGKEEG